MNIEKAKTSDKYLIKRYFSVDNSPYLGYSMGISKKR